MGKARNKNNAKLPMSIKTKAQGWKRRFVTSGEGTGVPVAFQVQMLDLEAIREIWLKGRALDLTEGVVQAMGTNVFAQLECR